MFGLQTSRSWNTTAFGRETTNTVGLQVRHDRLDPVGLYATERRRRVGVTQESRVRETEAGLYLESATVWTPWLRTIPCTAASPKPRPIMRVVKNGSKIFRAVP